LLFFEGALTPSRNFLTKVAHLVSVGVQEIHKFARSHYDPNAAGSTIHRDPNFRNILLEYYPSQKVGVRAKCQVSGVIGNGKEVVAAHLIPARALDIRFQEIGLSPEDKNTGKNGLLLAKNIEQAFDQKRLCFEPNPKNKDQLLLIILDKAGLQDMPVYSGYEKQKRRRRGAPRETVPPSLITIGSLHHATLEAPREKICYRLFSRHAFFSHVLAREKGWVTDQVDLPDDFGTPIEQHVAWLSTRETYVNHTSILEGPISVNIDELLLGMEDSEDDDTLL
jgi:hypothetical protein